MARGGLEEDPRADLPRESVLHVEGTSGASALDAGLDEEDARHVLANLEASDFVERAVSKKTGEWLYVFKPGVGGVGVYVKVVLRGDCIVISFHEDEGQINEDN